MGVTRQIIGSFEDIGEKVFKEVVKAPKDIAGKALESLGTSSGKQQKSNPQDEVIKKATARAALEELSGMKPKPKEPSVREKLEMEEKQKKEMLAKKEADTKRMQLPQTGSKQQRGDWYGLRARQTAAERKHVRQD